jgi:hypothetical protein
MIYRKAKNAKVYYAIDGNVVCRVNLKSHWYEVMRCENWIVADDAQDTFTTMEITEAEFLSAYKIAKTGTDIEVTFI